MTLDEQRTAFVEKWGQGVRPPIVVANGVVTTPNMRDDLTALLATARREGMEEAAKCCDSVRETERNLSPDDRIGDGSPETAEICAEQIRTAAIRQRARGYGMSSCEKCWSDSRAMENYQEVLESSKLHPCTPEEQAGQSAESCPVCKRKTLHQYTREPMCGCKFAEPDPGGR